jgi:hypothetical protein
VFRTEDGGRTWAPVFGPPRETNLASVCFAADNRQGWAVGASRARRMDSTPGRWGQRDSFFEPRMAGSAGRRSPANPVVPFCAGWPSPRTADAAGPSARPARS